MYYYKPIPIIDSFSQFILSLIGTLARLRPHGAMTYRERILSSGSHIYFFDHRKTWRASLGNNHLNARPHTQFSLGWADEPRPSFGYRAMDYLLLVFNLVIFQIDFLAIFCHYPKFFTEFVFHFENLQLGL